MRLTPCGRKSVSELVEVIHPGFGNCTEDGILTKGKVTNKHGGVAGWASEWIRVVNSAIRRNELKSSSRTVSKCPVVVKETVQVIYHELQSACSADTEETLMILLPLLHFVGVLDQMTSRPLVTASSAFPVPTLLAHPRSCISSVAFSGAGPKSRKRTSALMLLVVRERVETLTCGCRSVCLAKGMASCN